MENTLVQLYLLVCHSYDSHSSLKYQRASNFKPTFTDEEIITVYLFGQFNEKFNHRQIHSFIREYWSDWFPRMPSYQAFNRRLNLLTDNFQILFARLLETVRAGQASDSLDYLIDSLPVMLAVGTRATRGRVALEFAKCGFCATKQINFHGVRLHSIGNRQAGALPVPARLWLREGNLHDLTALREIADDLPSGINLFGDKAYADATFSAELRVRGIRLLTPVKKPKKGILTSAQKLFNKTVSSFRQPIESFFKWLIDKTDLQRASQVRSTDGLIIHCLGKLTFALFLLNFYY